MPRLTCRVHAFGCVELVKQHGSTRSSDELDYLDTSNVSCGVETWRAKWNLGFTNQTLNLTRALILTLTLQLNSTQLWHST